MSLPVDAFTLSFLFFYFVSLIAAVLVGGVLRRGGFPVPKGPRFGNIDGLRGFLALSVLSHHFWIWTHVVVYGQPWSAADLPFVNQLGAGAVALFFMITGLVFYPTALKGINHVFWPKVYVGRFFRIVPLVAISFLLISLVIALRTGARPDASYARAALEWISAHREVPIMGYADSGLVNALVLWSLWQEWLFYLLLLPVVALGLQLAKIVRLPSWTVPLLVLAVGAAANVAHVGGKLVTFWPLFAAGMLAYELCARDAIRRWLASPLAAILATLAMIPALTLSHHALTPAFFAFAFFFCCVAAGNGFGGIFSLPGAAVVGEISFGIYLLHGILLNLLFVDATSIVRSLPLAALPLLIPALAMLIVLVTAVTYLLIERPAWRFGKRLGERLRPVASPIPATAP
ncbi:MULTISPECIES: acyltransferase family protein [Sphingomonas]|uniref:Peptidoglycan/LPS O-acetylase OafA/YrhL n=1 Tax=Sphingomonas trueperi TaxID=53317 RepID=A0A7X6BE60_9SPHN|nr:MULTISPECIES: acyltransferase family protein [unclassified Sphingomonas]NJB98447.1 peptidoglycan/LPS O-acetylase OafA/YrhL [Sphingomonas trueperi]